jgi:spermidine/putrescine-binding protein
MSHPTRAIPAIVLCAAALLGGCGKKDGEGAAAPEVTAGPAAAGSKVVNVYNWSDYIEPTVIEAFEKETGVKVNYEVMDSNELLETKLLTGNSGYDVVVPTAYFLERQIQAGVFRKLDKARLGNLAQLDPELLLKTLVTNRMMVTFFNDVEVSDEAACIPAAQYFGTKGFFGDYDARLDEPVRDAVWKLWREGFEKLQRGTLVPADLVTAIHAAEQGDSPSSNQTRGAILLRLWNQLQQP